MSGSNMRLEVSVEVKFGRSSMHEHHNTEQHRARQACCAGDVLAARQRLLGDIRPYHV